VEIRFVANANLPTALGDFVINGFEDIATGKEHVVLSMGDITTPEPVLCRIHSECLTGDALFSLRCDCGPQLQFAMQKVAEAGRGIFVSAAGRPRYWPAEQNPGLFLAGSRC